MASLKETGPAAGRVVLALCGVLGVTALQAQSAPAAKSAAIRGEHIARQLCTACHVVAADQEFPPILRQPTPSFPDIANRPGITAASLRQFISSTHWDEKTIPMQMPSPGLSQAELGAVSAYILSLRKP